MGLLLGGLTNIFLVIGFIVLLFVFFIFYMLYKVIAS